MTAFEEMGVLREIAKATEDLGWSLPTDVQAEAIPLILGGGDVLMAAETGSGKTGAFCLPILQIVWETLKDIESGKGLNTSTEISNKSSLSSPWGLSLYDRGRSMAVTPNGLRCQSREQREWHGCRANKGIQGPGKYYYEATVTDEGLCRVGWSTSQASLDLGTDKYSFGYGGTGKKSNSKKFDDYGTSFGIHDVIGCLIDFDNGEISFTKNGINLGKAFDLNQQQKKDIYYPAVVLKNAEMSFNFGDEKFKHIPNNGYIGVKLAPDNSIKLNPINSNNQLNKIGKFESSPNAPQAIIIEPSKELATQTYEQINKFGTYIKDPKIKQLLVIGGTSAKEQIDKLNKGVDIVVGTPGRLEDLIQGGYLSLTHCRFFVLDEADGLLKQGYTGLIDRIYKDIPKITPDNKRLQMIVCSATLHDFEVKKMANKLMHYPTWVDLKGEDAVPDTVHHVVAIIDPQIDKSWKNLPRHIQTDGVHYNDNIKYGNNETPETLSEAVKILKGEYCIRAIRQNNMDRALIFCRTKNDCDNLENYLLSIDKNEFSCVSLHADKKQHERKLNLEKFKNKQVKFLICTDVAARGIDINGLPFMINMTLPDEKSNYVHRIGRVGRADRMGLAISLVSNVPEKVWYHGQWCSSRGRNCNNTNLTDHGGCCIWYKEKQTCLADIEEHLLITIQQINSDMKVPVNEFDGKVVYGQKKIIKDNNYNNHVQQLASDVDNLAKLESTAQLAYLQRYQTISY